MDVCLQIKQKKFEVLDRRMMFNGLMALMSVTGAVPTGRPPDPHLQGDQVTSRAAIEPSRNVTLLQCPEKVPNKGVLLVESAF